MNISKKSCSQKQPSWCIFQYRCSGLIVKFLKKYLWQSRVQLLANLHVMLSNFEALLRKFKYFITALINVEQLLLWNTSRKLLCVLKIWGKFWSGIINKPHVGKQQLYWELWCRRSRGNFLECLKQYPQLFPLAHLSITIKSN